MVTKKRTTLILTATLTALVGSVSGQTVARDDSQELNLQAYVELLRSDLKSRKVAILTQVMEFTPAEASTFWPIYKEYDDELSRLGDQKLQLIKDYAESYGDITDQKAGELVNKVFDLEEKRTALKRRYYERFKRAMPAVTAARFVQVENQILMLIDLQIASRLPVVR